MTARAWDLSLGPYTGVAGEVKTLTVNPQCRFAVEKVMASDSSGKGTDTRIMSFVVGQRIQRPVASGSSLAMFFGPATLGNGLRWDACEKGLAISVTVSFVNPSTFDATLFGRADL